MARGPGGRELRNVILPQVNADFEQIAGISRSICRAERSYQP
jgi:hypothetical protein